MDCSWIGWCGLTPSEQAAWVQAVGSVLAIGAAIGIAFWQQRIAQQAREAESRASAKLFAYNVRRSLKELIRRHRQEVDRLDTEQPEDMEFVKMDTVPDSLRRYLKRLPSLGAPAADILTALGWIEAAQDMLDCNYLYSEHSKQFVGLYKGALQKLETADSMLVKMLIEE